MTPHVTVFTDATQNHQHASSVYAGLDLLARRHLITLSIRRAADGNDARLVSDPLTVCLRVTAPGRPGCLVAIDLHDQSDVFARDTLEVCDTYLKRSLDRVHLDKLPPGAAAKVKPFGLNYPCRTHGSTARFLWSTRSGLLHAPGDWIHRIHHQLSIPLARQYEQTPAAPLASKIVFQPRVWTDHEAPGEAHSINSRRVSLLRALRATFGDRFIGGLVPTRFAADTYPLDVTSYPSGRSSYVAMSKRNLIGIYSGGLWGSTAFKFSEYLAACQCIVAEPPRGELPLPLQAGKHYLPFDSLDQCVDACRRLLDDHKLAASMRRANHEYYLSSVEPSARMARVVHIAAAARS